MEKCIKDINIIISELFETNHIDNNTLDCIKYKINVCRKSEYEKLDKEEKEDSYYCDYFYDIKTHIIRPLYNEHNEKQKIERTKLYL